MTARMTAATTGPRKLGLRIATFTAVIAAGVIAPRALAGNVGYSGPPPEAVHVSASDVTSQPLALAPLPAAVVDAFQEFAAVEIDRRHVGVTRRLRAALRESLARAFEQLVEDLRVDARVRRGIEAVSVGLELYDVAERFTDCADRHAEVVVRGIGVRVGPVEIDETGTGNGTPAQTHEIRENVARLAPLPGIRRQRLARDDDAQPPEHFDT